MVGGEDTSRVHHIVLTRFSYRLEDGRRSEDPLEPATLRRRLELFRSITVPSLVRQTSADFDFVVLVDPLLPPSFRGELE